MTQGVIITWLCRDSSQSSLSMRQPKPPMSQVSGCLPNAFIFQSLRLNLCLNALLNSVGYEGLGALHCFGYFSNYIDIKPFSPPVHRHAVKIFSWLYLTDMLQQFNFLASRGHLASLCPVFCLTLNL